jgi:hypothetical protein
MCQWCDRGIYALPRSVEECEQWVQEDAQQLTRSHLLLADAIIQLWVDDGILPETVADNPEFLDGIAALIKTVQSNTALLAIKSHLYAQVTPGFPRPHSQN